MDHNNYTNFPYNHNNSSTSRRQIQDSNFSNYPPGNRSTSHPQNVNYGSSYHFVFGTPGAYNVNFDGVRSNPASAHHPPPTTPGQNYVPPRSTPAGASGPGGSFYNGSGYNQQGFGSGSSAFRVPHATNPTQTPNPGYGAPQLGQPCTSHTCNRQQSQQTFPAGNTNQSPYFNPVNQFPSSENASFNHANSNPFCVNGHGLGGQLPSTQNMPRGNRRRFYGSPSIELEDDDGESSTASSQDSFPHRLTPGCHGPEMPSNNTNGPFFH